MTNQPLTWDEYKQRVIMNFSDGGRLASSVLAYDYKARLKEYQKTEHITMSSYHSQQYRALSEEDQRAFWMCLDIALRWYTSVGTIPGLPHSERSSAQGPNK